MHNYPFLQIKNIFLSALIFFAIISYSRPVHSQTIIREKIKINPSINADQNSTKITMQTAHIVRVTIKTVCRVYCYYLPYWNEWECKPTSATAVVTSPISHQVRNVEGTALFDEEGVYIFNISFRAGVIMACHQGASVEVYLDENLIYSLYEDDACDISGQFEVKFPPPPPPPPPAFEFGIDYTKKEICGSQHSQMNFTCNKEISSLTDKTVRLNIESGDADVQFYDYYHREPIGKVAIISLEKSGYYSVSLNSPYIGAPKQIIINGSSNGAETKDTLILNPSTFKYTIYPDHEVQNVIHGKEIKNEIYTFSSDKCTDYRLPDSTKYNLSIIKGSHLGHLADPFTDKPVNSISNLAHANFGEAEYKFIADGINPVNLDTAIVRISTTDSRILPTDVKVIVKEDTASHVKAYFAKRDLSPGDTVQIIIKNVDRYGNERDYPAETEFEAAIIEGCNTGRINGISTHLTQVKQPITFVVNDALEEADSLVVLRIGAPPFYNINPITKPQLVNPSIQINNISFIKREKFSLQKRFGIVGFKNFCTDYSAIYTENYDAQAKIKKCGGADTCDSNNLPEAPKIVLTTAFSSNKLCEQVPALAFTFFNYLGESTRTPPLMKPTYYVCYNRKVEKWVLKLIPNNQFVLQIEQQYCWEKIKNIWLESNKQYPVMIENYKTFKLPKDPEELRLFKKDLEEHHFYPIQPSRIKKYILKEFVIAHEEGHVNTFKQVIERTYKEEKYAQKFLTGFNYPCSNLNNKVKASSKAKEFLIKYEGIIVKSAGQKWVKTFFGEHAGDDERIESKYNIDLYNKIMPNIFTHFNLNYIPAREWWN